MAVWEVVVVGEVVGEVVGAVLVLVVGEVVGEVVGAVLVLVVGEYNEQNSEGLAHKRKLLHMVTLGMQNLSSSMQESTMPGTGLAYVLTKGTGTICQSQSILPNTNMC